jgi:magnesium-transporting ATPase (P-type)
MKLPRNNFFNLAVLFCLLGQFFVIYVPFFQNIFQTEPLSLSELIYITMVSSFVKIIDEVGFHSKKRFFADINHEYTSVEKSV